MEDRLSLAQATELSDEADRIQSLPVTREGKRPLVAFIAAVLAAALLAACGGSDSSSSTSTEATSTSSSTTDTTASNDGKAPGGSQSQDGGQAQNGVQDKAGSPEGRSQNQQSGGGSDSQSIKTPLKVSGGGAEQFVVKGGDNSVQEFGDESDESELQEAAEVVHGFYVARAESQWDTACSYLSKSNIEGLEKLASQSSQAADCATILEAFTRPLPADLEREITTVDAGSLRREGDQGFLIYYGAGHETYAMPLIEEGGSWKLTALSGTTLS